MFEVSVHLKKPSVDISQLAGRFGGICSEETTTMIGLKQKFEFNLDSSASQFQLNALRFPEVISIEGSPNCTEKAIASSERRDCGITTKAACNDLCLGIIDQQEELAQEFPTLDQLKKTP